MSARGRQAGAQVIVRIGLAASLVAFPPSSDGAPPPPRRPGDVTGTYVFKGRGFENTLDVLALADGSYRRVSRKKPLFRDWEGEDPFAGVP